VTPRIALVGLGYWGRNLYRVLRQDWQENLVAVCDTRADAAASVTGGDYTIETDFDALISRDDIDAIVLATPPSTHRDLGIAALAAGKHLFVEKPLALAYADASELVERATQQDTILMVGHTFLYNDAYQALATTLRSGDLGDLQYVVSERLNLGIVSPEADAWWDLAPHDISMLLDLVGDRPSTVTVTAGAFVHPEQPEVVFATLRFPTGVIGSVQVSRLYPVKRRRMTAVGTERMAIYDDVSMDAKLKVFDKSIRLVDSTATFGEFQTQQRWGDAIERRIEFREPLKVEMKAFVEAIESGVPPLSNGELGADIVRILEAGERSWTDNETIEIDWSTP